VWSTTIGTISDLGILTTGDTPDEGVVSVTCVESCSALGQSSVTVIAPVTASLRVNGEDQSTLKATAGDDLSLEWETTEADVVTLELRSDQPGFGNRTVLPKGTEVIQVHGDMTITLRAMNVQCASVACSTEKTVVVMVE
jgi:hypothetical protein